MIAKNIKRLNIVTNHINKCKRIEEHLYDEFGIMLNVSNNKKTSLLRAEVIINIDFPAELLNKYNIYDKAIIINILEKITIQSKKFNGVNASFYKISLPKKLKLEGFSNELIYESYIYNLNLSDAIKKLNKDKVRIKKLIGNNGAIRNSEII